jgi:hypothetical protein
MFIPPRALFLLAAVGLIVGVPAAEGLARSRKPPVAEAPPPPPPPPPPGPVGLPDRMIQDAAAYDSFMRKALTITPAFTDAASVSQAMGFTRAYSPKSLVRGGIAYAAIAALQDPDFVASVRAAGNTPENRLAMVSDILANPVYLQNFKDSNVAAGLAQEALGPRAVRLHIIGRAVHQAAYDIQRQGWSKVEVADLNGRLAAAEAAANGEMTYDPDALAQERQSAGGAATLPTAATPLTPPYTPMVAHALQLAAIAALGEARDDDAGQLGILMADENTASCLGSAKRYFHECLAVAKPNYEDVFCIGEHGLKDTGACLATAAGAELPPEPPPPPPLVKTSKPVTRHTRHHRA